METINEEILLQYINGMLLPNDVAVVADLGTIPQAASLNISICDLFSLILSLNRVMTRKGISENSPNQ